MSKAKIVFTNGDYIVADMTVKDATSALAGTAEAEGAEASGGLVEVPVTKKVYDKTLQTINIAEKQSPAYTFESTTKQVNPALVQMVVEASDEETELYTGSAEADSE